MNVKDVVVYLLALVFAHCIKNTSDRDVPAQNIAKGACAMWHRECKYTTIESASTPQ